MNDRLTQISLLRDLDVDISRFALRARWRTINANETLVDFDDPSSDVYFLTAGEVRVLIRTRSGKEVILGEMKAGSLFGELAAFDGIKRSANVTALTRGEVCVMSASTFRELVLCSPQLSMKIFQLMARRVRDLDSRLMEQTVLDLRHRLYAELLRLSVARSGSDTERVVTPPPFHHVLAARIGCRREQVTREFTAMAQEKLIERNRGALVLCRPEVLQARVATALREDH